MKLPCAIRYLHIGRPERYDFRETEADAKQLRIETLSDDDLIGSRRLATTMDSPNRRGGTTRRRCVSRSRFYAIGRKPRTGCKTLTGRHSGPRPVPFRREVFDLSTRIVVNQCLMRLRSARRATGFTWTKQVGEERGSLDLTDSTETPETQVGTRELSKLLQREIRRIPPLLRRVFELRESTNCRCRGGRAAGDFPPGGEKPSAARPAELRDRLTGYRGEKAWGGCSGTMGMGAPYGAEYANLRGVPAGAIV